MSDRTVILEDDDGLVLVDAEFIAQPAPVVEKPEPVEEPEPLPVPTGEEGQSPETVPAGQAPSQRVTSTKPEEAEWDEWHRRQDAVRTLAREFDAVDHGDVREYLTGRVQRELTDEEVGQLLHDVTAQRVADITEVFDEQLRSTTERMKRARRTVRVQAPRGWIRRAFGLLDERAVGQVAARLIQRGHDPEIIKEKVIARMKDEEARSNLDKLIDDEKLSVEFDAGSLVPPLPQHATLPLNNVTPQEMMEFASGMAESIASNMPVPDIYVEVPVNVGGAKKTVKRNSETGLIEEIEEG